MAKISNKPDEYFYDKFPNIVRGSIESVPRCKKILRGKNSYLTSNGKICVVKCVYADTFYFCQKTKIVNLTSARTARYCLTCRRHLVNIKRNKRKHAQKERDDLAKY